ncbi:MAG: glycosyltransferase family 2 protein [Bacteroidales bacterium]
MSKTLVLILNHNLPEYTNWLYNALKEFQDETYDTMVMDNGSKPELMPATVHIRFEKNLYWGGALNEAFKLVLKDNQYDSLLFLNNDIEVTAETFVRSLRNELFGGDFAVVSPSLAGRGQPWKQMQNWGNGATREVVWADNQAPLYHRKLIEAIGQFDEELYYGWGQELVIFDLCREKGWKIGVCDHICILHVGNQTLLQQRLFLQRQSATGVKEAPLPVEESHGTAMKEYRTYFANHPLKHGDFEKLRAYGMEYNYINHTTDTHPPHNKSRLSNVKHLLQTMFNK